MAALTWGGGSNSPPVGGWSVAANWTGDAKPTNADDVTLNGTDTIACTCDEAIDVLSLTVAAAYSGKLDFADSAYAHAIGGDATFDGSGEVDCGDATITGSGNWDHSGQTTWTKGTSTVVLDGTTKTVGISSRFQNLTIDGLYTTSTVIRMDGLLTINATKSLTVNHNFDLYGGGCNINGTVVVNSGKNLASITPQTITLGASGSLTGDGTFFSVLGDTLINTAGGTWSVAATTAKRTMTVSGTFGGVWSCEGDATGETFTFGGAVTFTGAVTFDADVAAYEVDFASQAVTFQGGVVFSESVGTLTISNPGTITFSGSSNQTITTIDKALAGVVIDVDAGDIVLGSNITCDSITGTKTGTGDFDPAGYTITTTANCALAAAFDFDSAADCLNGSDWQIGGILTLDGQTLSATAGWDLDVAGAAVASGIGSVEYCTAGGTKIIAYAGPWTDGGNNSGWDFVLGKVATWRSALSLGIGIEI